MLNKICQCMLVLAFVASMFIGLPRGAFACSCMMPPDPQEALAGSDAVFAGQVVSIVDRNVGQQVSSIDPLQITFQVNTVWKSEPKPALTVSTARDSASCSYTFEQGREYVVYASVAEGQLQTNICSRTALLADAHVDVTALGEGQTVAQLAPQSSPLLPWVLGGLGVVAVLALILFGSGLFMIRRKQE